MRYPASNFMSLIMMMMNSYIDDHHMSYVDDHHRISEVANKHLHESALAVLPDQAGEVEASRL